MVESISLKNTATMAVLELDKVTTPNYILESVDWGDIEGKHHNYKYVNQVGVYITGTSLGTRDIEIYGWVVANSENEMTARKQTLNRFVNPQQKVELGYSGYKLYFNPNGSIKYSINVKENNEVMCKFKIEGTCADPLFRDDSENRITAVSTKARFHFPMVLGLPDDKGYPRAMFGLREPSLIIDVYNKGAVATGMKIVFKALGTLVNPILTNVNTQDFFKINKTMHAGEEIEINTGIGEKKIIGRLNGVEYNYFKYRDLDSTWLQLAIGDNLFRYDADTGIDNLEVYVYFSNKYLEVQGCY